ncbi:MAG: S8 family serine peptidase, partial [Verrucomicrobiae bacterium]|nr:S8 family serine peptidase [Verrucomicrobiae bacterium]
MISLLCFVAAIGFWLKGNEVRQRLRQSEPPPATTTTAQTSEVTRASASGAAARATGTVALLSRDTVFPRRTAPAPATPASAQTAGGSGSASGAGASAASPNIPDPKQPYRLRNTAASIDALLTDDRALLLRNALIDTRRGAPFVPDHLRSTDEAGAYIVQARGPITDGFRRAVAAQGGVVTSYLPNNAYLVQGDAAMAQRLEALTVVQTVLPYEPYYKVAGSLLEAAVNQEPVPAGMSFNLTLFPGTEAGVMTALADAGTRVLGEMRTPFGPRLTVQPSGGELAALAALPGVQLIEPCAGRVLLNDLSRERLGVSLATADTNETYFDLTGSNIWVNVNDTGVDAEHPDLKGRVFADDPTALTDPMGHGTHVAGTIASTGENSPDPDPTNGVPGSVTGANFRGHAPGANLFVMEVSRVTGPAISDVYLQETAARTNYLTLARTNPLVSNNSWGYRLQFDYDTAAASYDAATRDAVPDEEGSQSILYVFSAGNDGAGGSDGQGGEPGTISSPGTSKNGITVGGIDSPRFITNEVSYLIGDTLVTNAIWFGETDSNDEVAPFSSRGNVGLGIEGDSGRYKPDLVAPAAFVASARAQDWTPQFMATNEVVNVVREQVVLPDVWNDYSIQVPANTTKLTIETLPGPNSPSPFPDLGIYARYGDFPELPDYVADGRAEITDPTEGSWYYSIANTTSSNVNFNIMTRLEVVMTETNYIDTLETLNDPLAPDYRFASGTSSAAANISGLLALIQEFFEVHLEQSYTPALLKALLINRAHSLGPAYSFEVRNLVNYQGWGIPELPLVLPSVLTNSTDEADWPVRWLDQSPTNAIATGDIQTYDLTLPEDAQQSDLRITLVWTDPPGNPAASVKLVNDLDLVLSNTVTGEFYIGNEIVADSDYNVVHLPDTPEEDTNAAPAVVLTTPGDGEDPGTTNQVAELLFDRVNNVENIFLRRPLDTNYVLQVIGRRVNVNAVTAHTNNVVQDFALVVSLATSTNGFEFARADDAEPFRPPVTTMTNGIPLFGQLVGANAPLIGTKDGVTNQWHFYAFTNTPMPELGGMTNNGPYVAFITFSPPEKAILREDDADIELYVSRDDPGLLDLDPDSILLSDKSLLRGGTEMVAYTNSYIGEVFHIGVKSEDMQAAEYSIVGLSSDEPFGTLNPDGSISLRGLGVPAPIPDGSPVKPGGLQVFAVGIYPGEVGSVTVSNLLYHESMGDLYTEIWHSRIGVGLHNHASGNLFPEGILGGIYDDSQSGESYDVLNSDGPGTLLDFLGTRMEGPWIFGAVDNALSRTGLVQEVTVNVRPNPDLLEGYFDTVLPNQFRYYFIDVPADASLLTVQLSQMTGPLNVYLRRGAPPTLVDYDKMASLTPPGGELTLGTTDSPPLTAGRYYIGVYNPTAVAIDYFIKVRIDRDLSSLIRQEYVSEDPVGLGDDLRTTLTNTVEVPLTVTEVNVGLRVDHPRISDLDFHLVSPDGTRLLLVEERGRTNLSQLGFDAVITNFQHVALTYDRASGLASLYLDGELQAEEDVGDVRVDTRESLFFGERPVTNNLPAPYRGTLDQVTLHTRALLPGEIRAITRFGGGGLPLDSLLSLWPFDGDALDAVSDNHGIVEGATFVPGKFGQAVDFRLADDHVVITNATGLDVGAGPGFTLDGWINPADLSTNRTLAVWSNGTNTLGLEFGIVPGSSTNTAPGRLFANLRDTSGTEHMIIAAEQGLILTNQVFTNTYYVTLTDNTNVAKVPIKFAQPDTNLAFSLTNRLVSGLEPVTANPLA